jgi:hypothetical protein
MLQREEHNRKILLEPLIKHVHQPELDGDGNRYKAFGAPLIKPIRIEEDGFVVRPEIIAKLARKGCRMYEVRISYSGWTYAEGKKINWKDGVRAIYAIFKYNLEARRH